MLIELTKDVYVEAERVLTVTEDGSNNAVVLLHYDGGTTSQTVTGISANEVYRKLIEG